MQTEAPSVSIGQRARSLSFCFPSGGGRSAGFDAELHSVPLGLSDEALLEEGLIEVEEPDGLRRFHPGFLSYAVHLLSVSQLYPWGGVLLLLL